MNFADYIKGKRVAVVGPAGSIHDSNQGETIDQYDIIVRFNSAVPIKNESKKDIGSRTDILCNCLEEHPVSGGHIDPEVWINENVSWVLCPYPKELWYVKPNYERFEKLNKSRLQHTCPDKPFFDDLEKKLKTRPNSGLLGMLYLLSFNPSELYVTGITFGRGGYRPGYKDGITAEQYDKLANSTIHKQAPQEALFREVYMNDTRIKTDIMLSKILGERNEQ